MFNFGLRGGDLLPRLLRLLRLEALPTRSRIRPRTDVLLLWSELVKLNGFLSVVLDLSGLCPPPCLRHLQVRWLNFVIPLFLQSLQYTTLQTTQRRLYLCVFFFIRFQFTVEWKMIEWVIQVWQRVSVFYYYVIFSPSKLEHYVRIVLVTTYTRTRTWSGTQIVWFVQFLGGLDQILQCVDPWYFFVSVVV